MTTAFIKTYGCQMNEQDSLMVRRAMRARGIEFVEHPEAADVLLINTCTVREKAHSKLASELGRWRLYKEINPQVTIGVLGCVAQQDQAKLFKRFSFLDLVVGPDEIGVVADFVQQSRREPGKRLATALVARNDYQFLNLMPAHGERLASAFVNIQKGCDKMCSFCIVPFVRGREVSRPAEDILGEIQRLTEVGVKEVTLLGQNVNAYGVKGEAGTIPFVRLLERIAAETTLARLRFTTSHPSEVDKDLMLAFRDNPILCPHLHLPMQSGSDAILRAMRRWYTAADVAHIVARLRSLVAHFCFTSDIIVGFPGESESDFRQTLDLMRATQMDHSFSFVYSPRPGTKAAEFVDDAPWEIKQERLQRLLELQRELSLASNSCWLGRQVEVLVDSYDTEKQVCSGRTPQNRPLHFLGEAGDEGEFVAVCVVRALPNSLLGSINRGQEKGFGLCLPASYGDAQKRFLGTNEGDGTHD